MRLKSIKKKQNKMLLRVVVVGESGTGKSSLVSCISGKPVSKVIEEVKIKTQDETKIHLIDTNSKSAGPAMESADVILVVYRADRLPDMFKSVSPWLDRVGKTKKVLLIGTHIDYRLRVAPENPSPEEVERLLDGMVDPSSEEHVFRCMEKYPQVCGSLEVSNALKANTSMVLSIAYSVVKHPRAPLVDKDKLSKEFRAILRRIFFLLDRDGDGRLSEEELIFYRRHVLKETEGVEEAVKQAVETFKNLKVWSLFGVMHQGWEMLFEEMVLESPSLWTVWNVLNHYRYDQTLKLQFHAPLTSVSSIAPQHRYCFSHDGLAFIVQLHGRMKSLSGGLSLNNIRAMLALIPKDLLEHVPQWQEIDDVSSGEVVSVAGNGMSLAAFVAFWHLLLEPNTKESAVVACKICLVLGYEEVLREQQKEMNPSKPPVELRPASECDYHRILVLGNGQKTRSRIIRGAICGQSKNTDQVMSSDRRIVSAGKIDQFYVSSYAPSRLPDDLSRFDLLMVPFDPEEDIRAYGRACNAALACRDLCPVLFCSSEKPKDEHVKWCKDHGVDQIYDAVDSHALREQIKTCFQNPQSNRVKPTKHDLEVERKKLFKLQAPQRARTRDNIFLGLVLLAVLMTLVMSGSWSKALGVPSSLVSVVSSLIGAGVVVVLVKRMDKK